MRIRICIIAAVSCLAMTACDSDLEKVHYNEALSQPAVLAPLAPSYVLNAEQSDQSAITFKWSVPKINYSASVTTDLQMDLEVNQFADAVTLASTKTDSTYTITVGDLNAALTRLLANSGKEVEALPVSFRLVSTLSSDVASLVSNVVTTSIAPYAGEREYPQFGSSVIIVVGIMQAASISIRLKRMRTMLRWFTSMVRHRMVGNSLLRPIGTAIGEVRVLCLPKQAR